MQLWYLQEANTRSLEPEKEVKKRCAYARDNFNKLRNLFIDKSLNQEVKKRLMRCCAWSVLLHGVTNAIYTAEDISYLEAYEMWIYRRMLKIPWTTRA